MDNNLLAEFLGGLQFSVVPKAPSRVQHRIGSQYKVAQNLWCKGKCNWVQHPTVFSHSACADTRFHTGNSKTAQPLWAPVLCLARFSLPAVGKLTERETAICLWSSHVPSPRESAPLSGTNSFSRTTAVNTAQTHRNRETEVDEGR